VCLDAQITDATPGLRRDGATATTTAASCSLRAHILMTGSANENVTLEEKSRKYLNITSILPIKPKNAVVQGTREMSFEVTALLDASISLIVAGQDGRTHHSSHVSCIYKVLNIDCSKLDTDETLSALDHLHANVHRLLAHAAGTENPIEI
jgi:hypothetical protein